MHHLDVQLILIGNGLGSTLAWQYSCAREFSSLLHLGKSSTTTRGRRMETL